MPRAGVGRCPGDVASPARRHQRRETRAPCRPRRPSPRPWRRRAVAVPRWTSLPPPWEPRDPASRSRPATARSSMWGALPVCRPGARTTHESPHWAALRAGPPRLRASSGAPAPGGCLCPWLPWPPVTVRSHPAARAAAPGFGQPHPSAHRATAPGARSCPLAPPGSDDPAPA